jgi:hypothetical protein
MPGAGHNPQLSHFGQYMDLLTRILR